jgi:hypothetical protein
MHSNDIEVFRSALRRIGSGEWNTRSPDVEIVRFLGACEARGATLLQLLALHTRLDRQGTRLEELEKER